MVESIAGVVHGESADGQLNWATWLNILQSGVRINPGAAGAARVQPEDSGISIPADEVRNAAVAFSTANLNEYWRNRISLSDRIHLAPDTDRPIAGFRD